MKRAVLGCIMLLLPTIVFGGYLTTTVNINYIESFNGISSQAKVTYVMELGDLLPVQVFGIHAIDGCSSANCSQYGNGLGEWSDSIDADANYNTCYNAWVDGTELKNGTTQGARSSTVCVGPPPPPRCYLFLSWDSMMGTASGNKWAPCGETVGAYATAYEGYLFTGWSGDISSSSSSITFVINTDMNITANFEEAPPNQCDPQLLPNCSCDPNTGVCVLFESPLIINLARGSWQLTGLDDPVLFDIRATGRQSRMGWTAKNSAIAFLALDKNANGTIDNGSELFGNATRLPSGQLAPDGFAALAQYDANNDGVIDQHDPIWTSLLLWIDLNHDGMSQPDELMRIAGSPVTAIELAHHWTGRRDASGNLYRYEGHVHVDGSVQTYYDVFFVTAP